MKKRSSLLRFLTISNPYIFVLFLGFAVGLAWIYPDAAASGGWLHPEVTTKIRNFYDIYSSRPFSAPFMKLRTVYCNTEHMF